MLGETESTGHFCARRSLSLRRLKEQTDRADSHARIAPNCDVPFVSIIREGY